MVTSKHHFYFSWIRSTWTRKSRMKFSCMPEIIWPKWASTSRIRMSQSTSLRRRSLRLHLLEQLEGSLDSFWASVSFQLLKFATFSASNISRRNAFELLRPGADVVKHFYFFPKLKKRFCSDVINLHKNVKIVQFYAKSSKTVYCFKF